MSRKNVRVEEATSQSLQDRILQQLENNSTVDAKSSVDAKLGLGIYQND